MATLNKTKRNNRGLSRKVFRKRKRIIWYEPNSGADSLSPADIASQALEARIKKRFTTVSDSTAIELDGDEFMAAMRQNASRRKLQERCNIASQGISSVIFVSLIIK